MLCIARSTGAKSVAQPTVPEVSKHHILGTRSPSEATMLNRARTSLAVLVICVVLMHAANAGGHCTAVQMHWLTDRAAQVTVTDPWTQ